MNNQKSRANRIYRVADFVSAGISWLLFFSYRKWTENSSESFDWSLVWQDDKLYLGLLIIPLFWLFVYYLFDEFDNVFRLSRISTFGKTLLLSFFGCIIILLTIIQDDIFLAYRTYANGFIILLGIHFSITVLMRIWIITWFKKRIYLGLVKFNTLIVGAGPKAYEIYHELSKVKPDQGYHVMGFWGDSPDDSIINEPKISLWRKDESIGDVIVNQRIDEVVIATEENQKQSVIDTLDQLEDLDANISIKISSDLHDFRLGSLKMSHVYGVPLLQLDQRSMPRWELFAKRLIDVVASILIPVVLSPLLLYLILRVKFSSTGSILFRQERIGKKRRPFIIYKFRSMYQDAEESGPRLSFEGDQRCTPWGAKMRKWRLDEIPQFYNVLIGDMSLVGPRPERAHYIEKIMTENSQFKYLFRVRPGITSLGQVKYGYASNLGEMLKRLKYDLIYIENMSLGLDIKILFYTLFVIVQGKGK